ncbi:MAG: hypothetical protein AAFV69_13790, partial [Pseudomonadota bacterium]
LRAFNLLDRIARRPSLWRKLPQKEKTFLRKAAGPKRVAAARRGQSTSRYNRYVRRGIDRRNKKRVACDTRKPSCKRFLAMKRRKGATRSRARAANLNRSRTR